MLKPKTPPPPPVPEVTEALSDSEQAQLVISATTTPATREEEKEEEKQTSVEAKKSSKKSFGPTRTTFHQDCELLCFRLPATRSGRDASKDEIPLEVDASISTEQNLVIEWRIPCSRFPSHTEATLFKEKDLAMGLFRLGSPDNLRSVVSKSIAASSQRRLAVDMFGNKQFRGRLAFRSPKTAGCFVFRLFDRSTPESAVTTLGTSSRFWNVLYDGDVTNMLLRSFEGFRPRRLCSDNNTALIQLRATIEGMKNAGRRVKNVDAPALMRQCVDIMLGLVELTLPVFEEQHRRALFKSSSSGKNDVQEVDAEGTVADTDMSYDMEADKPMGSEALKGSRKDHHFEDYSLCKRLHLEVFDTLTALSNSKIAFSMLPSPQSSAVLNMQQNFCSLNYRFYSSVTDKEAAVSNLLGFAVSDYEVITDSSSLQALNESILFTIPSLLPGSSFLADREAIARSVEVIVLHNHESISSHPASKVVLFGSSRNGFGSVSSDVDMCLLLGEGNVLSAAEKQNKIEIIGAALEEAGMQKVS